MIRHQHLPCVPLVQVSGPAASKGGRNLWPRKEGSCPDRSQRKWRGGRGRGLLPAPERLQLLLPLQFAVPPSLERASCCLTILPLQLASSRARPGGHSPRPGGRQKGGAGQGHHGPGQDPGGHSGPERPQNHHGPDGGPLLHRGAAP